MTTSTNQLVILPKKVKWQRASRPKVRTGCLTCKYVFLHLKCDEEKPTCRRCRDGRVKCDGYATPTKNQIQQRASMPVTGYTVSSLNPRIADTSIENCYFHHFHHWTSTQLTCCPGSSNFYLTYVLPLAHSCEPIKHAIIAVGAAHRFYMAGQETCSPLQQLKSLAMQQYNKSIQRIIPHMSMDSAFDLQCTLVCCLLFVAFEGITGRYAESIRHIRAGTKLLSSPVLINSAKEQKMARKLTEMFANLGVEASMFLEDTIIPDIHSGCLDVLQCGDGSDQPFQDLDEAASFLRKLDVETVDIISQTPYTYSMNDDGRIEMCTLEGPEKQELEAKWEEMDAKFEVWSSRFELTKKHIATWECQELTSPQLTYLNLQQAFWRMGMSCGPEDLSEPTPDTAEAFLNAAEIFSQRLITPGQPSFSLDGDLISGLSVVVWSCTEGPHRARALDLLRRLNRREGIWDSKEIVEMHEAALALDDPKLWYNMEIPGGVPGYVAELAKISPRFGLHRSGLLIPDFECI
ncbi:hypothetical protein BFJ66_g14974 [Fusarium oxysporum f. sp. cepae]|nr:hypothetical protein BFJ66_g14974 [Fusarium oxysporum f. sp. cepae]